MTATFNPALTSPLDKVRFKAGDRDVANAIVEDETIQALLEEPKATVLSVAVQVAQSMVAAYSQRVTYDVDGQGERWSDAVKAYRAILDNLLDDLAAERADGVTEDAVAASQSIGGGIMVGGLSRSENVRRSEDCDRAANFSPRYDG